MSDDAENVPEKAPQRDARFESLLRYLRAARGFDFTGYKRATLQRRMQKRMDQLGFKEVGEYHDYLEVHADEFAHLFNTILINVTGYFRDPQAWEYLAKEIVPRIIGLKENGENIRIWSAGCSSGEEAYTAAMVFAEAMGIAAFRDRVKLYATDVDEDALARARQGSADTKALEDVPELLRGKYFEAVGNRFVFRTDLRRSLIFGRHDLLQDAPISRLDLLICRNTLMYFQAETQGKILARLHYALNEHGYLFLGKAEMLLTRDALFQPTDLKNRVFTKVPKLTLRDRMLVLAQAGNIDAGNHVNRQAFLQEAAADAMPVAQLVLDAGGYLVMANERARTTFGLQNQDLGRPVQDLEISYRPLELRSPLEQAHRDRRPVEIRAVERHVSSGETQFFDVTVTPLLDRDGVSVGATVVFRDTTESRQVLQELERHKQELETASEELQSTNEELETTNEELQSTVEELETTNEELQSSNEELETMNEELESTNSELQTINTELQRRSSQLDQFNGFVNSVLSSLKLGVAVLDRELRVQMWNREAEELWGVRSAEVEGRRFVDLDIGLPVDDLEKPIQACLGAPSSMQQEVTVRAVNRRGRTIGCRVVCNPLLTSGAGAADGVVLLMEQVGQPEAVTR
jgi:two-component system CheB/CheR fusion protein